MNRFAKTAAASLLTLSSVAGASFAASPAKSIDAALSTMKSPHFTVESITSLDRSDPERTRLDMVNPASPEVHALQASISSNKTLSGELKAQNVEIRNIISADQAADGSVTFYVR